MLYIFEGMEAGQGGIPTPIDEYFHDTPARITVMNAKPDVIVASSLTTSTISTPSTSPARPDLPERQLTSFVNPLIGTEGFGHCINPCLLF